MRGRLGQLALAGAAWMAAFAVMTTGCGSSKTQTPAPQADFSLVSSPSTLSLTGGSVGQSIQVTVTGTNGFAGPVAVTVSGLPAGVTASPGSLSVAAGSPQKMTLAADATVKAGSANVTLTGIAGALTHTATVALTTVAAPPPPTAPDFTLTVTPASETIAPSTSGAALSVEASGMNGFASAVHVTLSGLPAGVTANPAALTLTPVAAQNVTLTASATAAIGAATVTFTGTAGSLSHAATLALTVATPAIPDVTTYHYDNARDGLNAQETLLTPANVNSATFGKLGFFAADGKVDAQPLYLAGYNIGGAATDVLYVASEHGSLYAYNADMGAPIWTVSLLGAGEGPSDDHGCGQITPEIGITSTPVIDRAKGVIFVVAMSKDGSSHYHQRLHALNLTTGAEMMGSPVEISGTYPGTGANSQNGNVIFDPGQYAERAALLLLNGTIYLSWTSHCDIQPYTGWVMAYNEATLQQTAILNLTPNGRDGSIWMSGNGPAADAQGNIYFLDANGTFDSAFDGNGFPAQQDYGNAIMKLSTAGGKLAVADFFEPYNTVSESNADIDLGSGGAMLLPDMMDANGTVRHLLVGAGKDTNIYLADRDNLGKFDPSSNSNIYQELPNALAKGAWSSPAYFNGTVYYAGQGDMLKAFPMSQARMAATPSSQSAAVFPYPGSTPSVSANGTQDAIVWALKSDLSQPGVLRAYDASNLAKELYNSNQAAGGRDSFGNGNKFITPVVVNGKVFVGTQTGVAEFGLLP
ncbi:MAG TPA: hypothetical protein VF126_03135 [Acidobacteriaceae bacterium]